MVDRRITFRDLLPYVAKAPENDPHGASVILADLLQHLYDKMRDEVKRIPRLLSPDFLNADYVLSGQLRFESSEQVGAGACTIALGNKYLTSFYAPFQVPVQNFFNGHGIYFVTGILEGEYSSVNVYGYVTSPPPTKYLGAMTKPWSAFSNTLGNPTGIEQIVVCYPDRVWLPLTASDTDDYYKDMYLRVAGGGPYLVYGADIQTRRIKSYDGTNRIAYLESALEYPPDPKSFFGITPAYVPMQYLGRHVGLDIPPDLLEGLKRQLVLNAINIYKLKGTKKGFEVLLKVLGWLSEIIEIGSNYARPIYQNPWYDHNDLQVITYGGGTALVPLKVGPEPDLPLPYRYDYVYAYNPGVGLPYQSWQDEYVKIAEDVPYQRQFDEVNILTQTAEGIGIPPIQTVVYDPTFAVFTHVPGVGTSKYTLDPTLDLAGDTANPTKIPDSDIKLFIGPAFPLAEVPNTSVFQDILRAIEDVRPIHVEIDGIGWLNKVSEPISMVEEFTVSLYLGVSDIVKVATAVGMFTGDQHDVGEAGGFMARVAIVRFVRWDVTEDHWDGLEELTGGVTWDTSVIAVGED